MAPLPSASGLISSHSSSSPQPTEASLTDFLHTSPELFWILVSVFAVAFMLGVVWVSVTCARLTKRWRMMGTDKKGEANPRRRWWWPTKTEKRQESTEHLEISEETSPKVDWRPEQRGWIPPVRTSSLAHLYYTSAPQVVVHPPPHEYGLPLAAILEEVEDSTVTHSNGDMSPCVEERQQTQNTAVDEVGCIPSIVISCASTISSDSASSLAYLYATSPLEFPFPHLQSDTTSSFSMGPHVQAPAVRSLPCAADSLSGTKKTTDVLVKHASSSQPGPRGYHEHTKENYSTSNERRSVLGETPGLNAQPSRHNSQPLLTMVNGYN